MNEMQKYKDDLILNITFRYPFEEKLMQHRESIIRLLSTIIGTSKRNK